MTGRWKRGDVARSINRDLQSSDAQGGGIAAVASAHPGAALKPRKPAGSKHDRNLSATNSDVATRPPRVESKDKKGTKERKRDLRQVRSPTSGNGRLEVDRGVKEFVTTNSSLKPRTRWREASPQLGCGQLRCCNSGCRE